jgi:hypothetical protein
MVGILFVWYQNKQAELAAASTHKELSDFETHFSDQWESFRNHFDSLMALQQFAEEKARLVVRPAIVRARPRRKSAATGRLQPGRTVTLVGRRKEWAAIVYVEPGEVIKAGWVENKLLK